ncbi:MAG TPA: TrkH family potassium uptake protein [Sphingomonadales bacterium]
MLDLRPVLYINGLLLIVLGLGMAVPIAIDLYYANPDWQVFLAAAGVTEFIGVALVFTNRGAGMRLAMRQAFLLTSSVWLILPAFGALPLVFSELRLSYTDAFFEAVSGLTTTGATVISGLDTAPPGLLIWRAILQWLGGVGIIVMVLSIMPALQIAGYQLFRTEFSDSSEKIVPRIGQLAGIIIRVYLAITALCILAYWAVGMPLFEAVAHAFATVATGGFSVFDASIGHYDSVLVEAVVTVFMALAAVPFTLYFRAVHGNPRALFRDNQVQLYFGLMAALVALLTLWLWLGQGQHPVTAFRYASFNLVAVMTGSGFATTDYQLWGTFAVVLFFFVSFTGGCAGSSSGGIKMFRFWILISMIRTRLRLLLQPHGVFTPRYNGRPVSTATLGSVMSFLFLFILSFLALTVAHMATGLDMTTAASGAVASLANVGPALGDIIGPAGNYQPLPNAAKWLLSIGMVLGRLELFTILVLLTPAFWRA